MLLILPSQGDGKVSDVATRRHNESQELKSKADYSRSLNGRIQNRNELKKESGCTEEVYMLSQEDKSEDSTPF